ncbi:hypothetical protein Aam_041_025 [Acidocella aminolytica 101 = DSM 11237]|uniref:Uncharacterized protein n=1 Tax=Acidocella aminolytica 101 = DSM 11237 TaxID=1120923 RepID=A0A0D6PGD0_9PROT|nr:hypothetical protein Aam_041_025 [Acidocella aminolytica 101 = DSM 11237]
MAIVRPVNISATAWARRVGGTRAAASTVPMQKKAQWQISVTIRASIRKS